MKACQDCGGEIKYGVGWGGGGVCHRCRAARAHRSRAEHQKVSGKPNANKWVGDPLEAK